MSRSYQDIFRPAFELSAAAAWAAAALAMAVLQPPLWPLLSASGLLLAGVRMREVLGLYRFRASISALRAQKIGVAQALEVSRRHWQHNALWLGRGFKWTQEHAEVARQIQFRAPGEIPGAPRWLPAPLLARLQPDDYQPLQKDAIGVGWIHGIDPQESDIGLNIDALTGHTGVVGTTRAGKTRLYELLTTQIVHRKKNVLLIIDPKNDKAWKQSVQRECARAGRKFLYFNPAFPAESIRINPLANWNSASEPANRIGQLVDADGSFAAFAWKTLFRIMRAQVQDGTMPTIRAAKDYVQQGVEPLLERLLQQALFRHEGERWEHDLSAYRGDGARGRAGQLKSERLQRMIAKFEALALRDEAAESLIAMVYHSREHYSKMIQVLEPILEMLGSDEVGAMLSPDPLDLADTRPIYDTATIIEEQAVLYVSLDSLSNKTIGSAIGSILLADFASVAGAIYNFQQPRDIYLFVDEAAEVMNEQAIQLLNKGGGAGIKAFIATQTLADFDAVYGSEARTRQTLGNLNNMICLRVKDRDTAEWMARSFGTTSARKVNRTISTGSGSSSSFTEFNGSSSQTMSEEEIPRVSPDLLTSLPGLQYFAFLAGSTLYKGRLPLLQ